MANIRDLENATFDIMSVVEGFVGAETFAAVTPRNNGKLDADLLKLSARQEKHRYVFFMSPLFQETSGCSSLNNQATRCGQSMFSQLVENGRMAA